MVSAPIFDPNLFVHGINKKNWDELIKHRDKPLINKSLSGLYPPGSTIKMLVAISSLENDVFNPKTVVHCFTGSKKELIRAVLARYLDVFMPSASIEINRLHLAPEHASLNEIFSALIKPLLELNKVRNGGTIIFLQLLGRGYIESQGHLRWFITTHYGEHLATFVKAVAASAPHIPQAEMFWRLHFTLGTIVFTMASADALNEIAAADYGEHNNTEAIIRKVIPYMAAGVAVPVLTN